MTTSTVCFQILKALSLVALVLQLQLQAEARHPAAFRILVLIFVLHQHFT